MNILQEKLSINSNVVTLTNKCGELLDKEVRKNTRKYLGIKNVLYLEDSFELETNGLIPNIDKLTIKYLVYVSNNYKELEAKIGKGHCLASFDDLSIELETSYLYGEGFIENIFELIGHEINHIFQYANGYKKSNNNDNLYNMVAEISGKHDLTESEMAVNLALSYSFYHEQVSFTQQFYQQLKNMEMIPNKEDALYYFNHFNRFLAAIDISFSMDKEELKNILKNNYGISIETFSRRIRQCKKRFRDKLSNAYRLKQEQFRGMRESVYNNINSKMTLIENLTKEYGKFKLKCETKYNFTK